MSNEKKTPQVPPFTVRAQTDNLRTCRLVVEDADGNARELVVASDGNVYQGLHSIKGDLESLLNDLVPVPAAADTVDELPPTEPETTEPAPKAKKGKAA